MMIEQNEVMETILGVLSNLVDRVEKLEKVTYELMKQDEVLAHEMDNQDCMIDAVANKVQDLSSDMDYIVRRMNRE